MEVRIERLRPKQIDDAMAQLPFLYMPLGTVEWHGRQNISGLDAVKAHELCVLAARKSGGLVMPALYGGVGGLDEPHTFVMDPENSTESYLLRPWLEKLCSEAVRQGFKAVAIVTGHYGASQQMIVREAAARMTRSLGCPILGTPEYFLALDEDYYGDHAAFYETSMMMHMFPDSVDLDELGEEPHQGVYGLDPKKHATAADGKRLCDAIMNRLVSLAGQMTEWDADTISRFASAEAAIVARQMELAHQEGHSFGGFRNVPQGAFNKYPQMLVEKRFDDIEKLVHEL